MSDSPAEHSAQAPRIGARLVVDLLRFQLAEPITDKIRLSPQRSKAALALLYDRLAQIQATLTTAKLQCSVVSALAERCSDQEIPLPIAEPDWGAITLLDDVFDELLCQHGLDAEAQSWFNQLRVPVVRYALQDYSFFFAQQNLVRRFLNQAYLALLSSTTKSRSVHRDQLNQFLKRILEHNKQDVSQFNSICIEAQAWFASQNQKVALIEQQLRKLESARRKEKVAEPRVVGLLNERMAGKRLPVEIIQFLHGDWRQSLQLISMREGEQGGTWKRQARVTESLVEFVEGSCDPDQREKYRSFYPVLMKNLKTLLVSAEDETALKLALDPVELVLTALVNGAVPDTEAAPKLAMANGYVDSVSITQVGQSALDAINAMEEGDWVRLRSGDGNHELCHITLKGSKDETWVMVSQSGKTVAKKNSLQLAQAYEGGVLQILNQSQFWDSSLETHFNHQWQQWQQARQAQLQAKLESQEKAQQQEQEPAANEPEVVAQYDTLQEQTQFNSRTEEILQGSSLALAETDSGHTDHSHVDDFVSARVLSDAELNAALQVVDSLKVGAWIVHSTAEGDQRCKLAVKIRGNGKLVFVNRLGIKALEVQRDQLASLIGEGTVTVQDTGTEFDNTLERVVRSIQKDKQ